MAAVADRVRRQRRVCKRRYPNSERNPLHRHYHGRIGRFDADSVSRCGERDCAHHANGPARRRPFDRSDTLTFSLAQPDCDEITWLHPPAPVLSKPILNDLLLKIRGVPHAGGDSRVRRVENICVCRQNEACGLTSLWLLSHCCKA
jgi:hypothetical protein